MACAGGSHAGSGQQLSHMVNKSAKKVTEIAVENLKYCTDCIYKRCTAVIVNVCAITVWRHKKEIDGPIHLTDITDKLRQSLLMHVRFPLK